MMGGEIGRDITTIALAIVGVAVLAVLVSRNSNTAGVIGASSGGFSQALATAEGPVTGYVPSPAAFGYGGGSGGPTFGMMAGPGGFGGGMWG
jgi:hypothetical protein